MTSLKAEGKFVVVFPSQRPNNHKKITNKINNHKMKNLLKLKELSPIDKLVILTIQENSMFDECLMTSQEIANSIGLSRKVTLDSIQKLEELDYIQCSVNGAFRQRKTKLTQRLCNLIK